MREILDYPHIEMSKLEVVKNLINCIAETTPDENYSGKLSELNRITGKLHEAIEFAEYWGWTDLDTLAVKVLTPEPPYINNLTKNAYCQGRIIRQTIIWNCFISLYR